MTMLATRSARLGRPAFSCLMGVGVWMMSSSSWTYLELGCSHPFVLEKLPLAHPSLWLAALSVHVPSALLALPACLVLLIRRVRTRFPAFHRWLGRVTGGLVLFGVVPSGMYLAQFARGGWITTFGFWLTGLIAFASMAKSIASARAKDMKAHRRFSTHVTAQLAVAVFSRVLLAGAERIELYGDWVYIAALWFPVLACAVVAELLTGPRLWSSANGSRHEELVANPLIDAVR